MVSAWRRPLGPWGFSYMRLRTTGMTLLRYVSCSRMIPLPCSRLTMARTPGKPGDLVLYTQVPEVLSHELRRAACSITPRRCPPHPSSRCPRRCHNHLHRLFQIRSCPVVPACVESDLLRLARSYSSSLPQLCRLSCLRLLAWPWAVR